MFFFDGTQLWRTDGSVAGTALILDLGKAVLTSTLQAVAAVGNLFFFSTQGGSVWRSDGTAAGTFTVHDSLFGEHPGQFTDLNGRAVFVTDASPSGNELWTSDGTAAGTQRVKDIRQREDEVEVGPMCCST